MPKDWPEPDPDPDKRERLSDTYSALEDMRDESRRQYVRRWSNPAAPLLPAPGSNDPESQAAAGADAVPAQPASASDPEPVTGDAGSGPSDRQSPITDPRR